MDGCLINSISVALFANIILSIIAYYISKIAIKKLKVDFIRAGLKGRDYGKKDEKIM